MTEPDKLPEIDYLTLAAVCHRERIQANMDLVKYLMKRGMNIAFPKVGEQRPQYYEHTR